MDLLVVIADLLTEMLAELKRANSIERTGAISSVSVETNSRGVVVGLKRYSGSEPEVTEALDDYGQLFREANARALAGWEQTVEQLLKADA